MKQLITVVITIAIVFIVLYRLSNQFRSLCGANRQPAKKDRGAATRLDFPAAASRALIRHLLY